MNSAEEKEKAVAFLKAHQVGENLQKLLNDLYKAKPGDVYGYMSDVLETYAGQPTINVINGYKVRSLYEGELMQISVTCNVRNHKEVLASTVVGSSIAKEVDLDVLKDINDVLVGEVPFHQNTIDDKLVDLGLPASVSLGVSLCIFHSAVSLCQQRSINRLQALLVQDEAKVTAPLPIVTMITGGKAAPGKSNFASLGCVPALNVSFEKGMEMMGQIYDKVEELLKKKNPNALPNLAHNGGFYYTCDKLEQMIELVKEASGELELEAGTHYHFVVNCGAEDYHTEVAPNQGSAKKGQVQSNSRHRYDWFEGQIKPTEDVCDMLEALLETESIVAFIDPLHKEDIEGYERLAATVGPKCHIMSSVGLECKGVGRVMGMGRTVANTLKNIKAAAECPLTVLCAAKYEEGDTLIADLALASNAKMVDFGGLKAMRAKLYSRLTQILQMESDKGGVSPAMSSWGYIDKPTTPAPDTDA